MVVNQNEKGSRNERELVNLLNDAGFAVMKATASGAATKRELPDVLAGNGDVFYAIEAKSCGDMTLYISGEQVDGLLYFAQNFGAKARIAVKFDILHGDPAYGNASNPGWYFFHPDDLYVTDGGNYRIKKETALKDGEEFVSVVGGVTQSKLD